MHMKPRITIRHFARWTVAAAVLAVSGAALAGDPGHYVGGLMDTRDYFVPDPGFYAALYNYLYTTDRYNDQNGNKVSSVTINRGPLAMGLLTGKYSLSNPPRGIRANRVNFAGRRLERLEPLLTLMKRIGSDHAGKTPAQVVKAPMRTLRACGFSTAKSLALKDLAKKRLDGTVPDAKTLHQLGDDEIVEKLIEVRGVGRWTVEMMLMFRMGRLDVLPVDDFGVRKGFSRHYRKRGMVTPKQLLAYGERWRPYRSVASWYMWRVLDA